MKIKKQALIEKLQTIINDISNSKAESIDINEIIYEGIKPYCVEVKIQNNNNYDLLLKFPIFEEQISLHNDKEYKFGNDGENIFKDKFKPINEPVIEKSIHDKFRELAQETWDKDQVCVSSVSIDWNDYRNPIKVQMIVNEVRMDTLTK